MTDPSGLERDAERLRSYAAGLAASARPAADPFEQAERWLARAGLLHEWPDLRSGVLGGRAHAGLLKHSETLADKLREPPSFGRKLFALGSSSAASPTEAADAIDKLCLALEPDPASLAERFAAAVATLADSGGPAKMLGKLLGAVAPTPLAYAEWREGWNHPDWRSDRASEPAGQWLDRLRDTGAVSPESAAAALLAWALVDLWSKLVRDREVWRVLETSLAEWFRAAGLNARLQLTPSEPSDAPEVRVHFRGLDPVPNALLVFGGSARGAEPRMVPVPPEPSAPQSVWRNLPKPPVCNSQSPEPLVAWMEAQKRGDPRRSSAPSEEEAKARFRTWLATGAGADWFDGLLRRCAERREGPEALWWRILRERDWCGAYPDFDPDHPDAPRSWSGEPEWPAAVTRPDARPAGTVLDVLRYSATPDGARVVVSEGDVAADSSLARFHDLFEATARDAKFWGDGRWKLGRDLSLGRIDPDAAICELADAWFEAAESASEPTRLIEAWLRSVGVTVIDPASTDADEVERTGRFHDSPVGAAVGRSVRGYKTSGGVLRRACTILSAGKPPAGLDDLANAARHWPADHPLPARVAKLADAVLGDYLLESALELFSQFWAQPVRDEAGKKFGEELGRFLRDGLRLEAFTPRSLHEHGEGSVTASPGSRMVTGIVRRVYRPGLIDDRGEVRIPALAEID